MALIKKIFEELGICGIPRKDELRMCAVAAASAALPPCTTRIPDLNLGLPHALARRAKYGMG
jgi:hypothetical protein